MLNSGMAELVSILKYNETDPKTALLRARLDEEGIPFFIKNEFAVKYRSPELQVMRSDLEKASMILSELNFDFETSYEQHPFIEKFDSFADKIPLLKSSPTEIRLFLILVIIAVTMTAAFYFVFN
jgi:hypothetical protein